MRRFRTILVLLLLGAVVNVAVAWGAVLAQFRCTPETSEWRSSHLTLGPLVQCRRTPGHERVDFGWRVNAKPSPDNREWWWTVGAPGDVQCWFAAGWPRRSLGGSLTCPGRNFSWQTADRHWAMVWQLGPTAQHVLGKTRVPDAVVYPLRPLWPGFLVNTLLYAVVAALLIKGPGFMRRLIRGWRGRCHRCGYPNGGTGVCSECGTALPTSAASSPTPRITPQP